MMILALAMVLNGATPAPGKDVWLAFVGDRARTATAASPTGLVDPVLGVLAQADLALDVAVQQIALPRAGIDWAVGDGPRRVAVADGCVAVVPVGGGGGGDEVVKSERRAGCFVVAVMAWDGPPGASEERRVKSLRKLGADLVVGHHRGALGGVGWSGGMPILWNVGSLFDGVGSEGGIFRVRLTKAKKQGYRLAEVDLKPHVKDAKTGRLRPPKEKEMAAIATDIVNETRRVGGKAKLEAAHIVFFR